MSQNIKNDAHFIKHATSEGVFVKHFYSKDDTDGCFNNMEADIIPGYQIMPHVHENATEFFYVVSGDGEFLDGTAWEKISKGSVFKAPKGTTHAIKNTGNEVLVLICTFSPATR